MSRCGVVGSIEVGVIVNDQLSSNWGAPLIDAVNRRIRNLQKERSSFHPKQGIMVRFLLLIYLISNSLKCRIILSGSLRSITRDQ